MPRSSRETLLRHCDRMKGNLDKALKHIQEIQLTYARWGRSMPPEIETIAAMMVVTQEAIDRFANDNLRA